MEKPLLVQTWACPRGRSPRSRSRRLRLQNHRWRPLPGLREQWVEGFSPNRGRPGRSWVVAVGVTLPDEMFYRRFVYMDDGIGVVTFAVSIHYFRNSPRRDRPARRQGLREGEAVVRTRTSQSRINPEHLPVQEVGESERDQTREDEAFASPASPAPV